MPYTVGELSESTGVTVRTLHHYDAIGLVRPSQRTAAGYRSYSDADVLRLQQVLLLRELGLSLDSIARALAEPGDRAHLLRSHRAQLAAKREDVDRMLRAVDAALERIEGYPDRGDHPMTPNDLKAIFDGFDPTRYEREAQERWGDTDAYRESGRRTQQYSKADWERYEREADANAARLVALMRAGKPVRDGEVQAAVEEHRSLIDRWFYPCSKQMHKALGEMYVQDPRFSENLDRVAPGYARYLSEAIAAS